MKEKKCKYCHISRSLKFQPLSVSTTFDSGKIKRIKPRDNRPPSEGSRISMENRIIIETKKRMDIIAEHLQIGYLPIEYPIYEHVCLLPEEIERIERKEGKRNCEIKLKTGETFEVKMPLKEVKKWYEENLL